MTTGPASLFAVIGRSANQPVLYHMNQTWNGAERLRLRREQATGQPCYVVPMGMWYANPLVALQRAETDRFRDSAKGSDDTVG